MPPVFTPEDQLALLTCVLAVGGYSASRAVGSMIERLLDAPFARRRREIVKLQAEVRDTQHPATYTQSAKAERRIVALEHELTNLREHRYGATAPRLRRWTLLYVPVWIIFLLQFAWLLPLVRVSEMGADSGIWFGVDGRHAGSSGAVAAQQIIQRMRQQGQEKPGNAAENGAVYVVPTPAARPMTEIVAIPDALITVPNAPPTKALLTEEAYALLDAVANPRLASDRRLSDAIPPPLAAESFGRHPWISAVLPLRLLSYLAGVLRVALVAGSAELAAQGAASGIRDASGSSDEQESATARFLGVVGWYIVCHLAARAWHAAAAAPIPRRHGAVSEAQKRR